MKKLHFIIFIHLFIINCDTKIKLKPVSVRDFSIFIDSTKYITDAEKFGWSFIQRDVYNFDVKLR